MTTPQAYSQQIDRIRDSLVRTGKPGLAACGATRAQMRAARWEASKRIAEGKK